MKLPQILTAILWQLSLASCVTTRSELNEKRGESENTTAVKSEDLNPSEPVPSTSATPAPVVPAPVSSSYAMEEMRAELAKLNGRIEELEKEKKDQQVSQSEEQKKLQAKVEELEKQLKEKEEQASGPILPANKSAFQAGKDAYHAGQYDDAISFFTQVLKISQEGKESEEASFLRGESYFKLKQYKTAIVDYSKFPEKYPKSKYHSKALLKIAECFDALGMKEDGQAFYQDLLDKFPKTVEGKLAKKKLSGKSSRK